MKDLFSKPAKRERELDFEGTAGPVFVQARDGVRLTGQIYRIYNLMSDGAWRTLDEIATITNDPPASVSAQLRHLRKKRFGEHVVDRQHLGFGLYQYRVKPNPNPTLEATP